TTIVLYGRTIGDSITGSRRPQLLQTIAVEGRRFQLDSPQTQRVLSRTSPFTVVTTDSCLATARPETSDWGRDDAIAVVGADFAAAARDTGGSAATCVLALEASVACAADDDESEALRERVEIFKCFHLL